MIKNNLGFTLIELMISLALGLIVVAAAIAIFLTGQRSLALQSAMSELQEGANFGLATIAYDLRHTNLNTDSKQKINNKQVGSGIIFDVAKNLPSSLSGVDANIITKQDNDNDATTGKSDRITIQYLPEYTEYSVKEKYNDAGVQKEREIKKYKVNATDCEGNNLDFANKRLIVQRYYLKASPDQISGQPTAYSLYCDAGNYISGDSVITGISATTEGQQIIQRIDGFKIRLGVVAPDKKIRYMTIDEYKAVMPDSVTDEKNYYNIDSVEVGILARSNSALNIESLLNNNKKFKIFGNETELSTTQKARSKYLRGVFSQVVAFRNTLGAA